MLAGTAKPRSEKKTPEFMKSFGWCTWDAFYSQVSAQGIPYCLSLLYALLHETVRVHCYKMKHMNSHHRCLVRKDMADIGPFERFIGLWQVLHMGWTH